MNARLGVSLKILSALCATLMLACVKGLNGAIPTGEVIFFRSFVALFPLLIWLKIQGNIRQRIKTKNIFGHLIRGFSGTGGMYFNYLALVYISLADATAISYAAPLFTVLMAAILLKENVHFSRWLAVIVGFCGILIMLSAKLTISNGLFSSGFALDGTALGATFALLAAACAATSNIQIRFLNGVESPGAIVFYFSLMTTLIGLFTLVFGWKMPHGWQWLLLIGCGLFGGIAQILVTLSLRYADASLLAPFDYTTLVWSMVIGYLFLDNLPGYATLMGASVVALAGIFTIWCNRRQRKGHIFRSS
ncbi:DMT family transporter [Pectobacterium atrosepticum]|uniref:DMT family transporter n=1 Tax=Pectobacterium atrosepticum TaxID=29471 RepID=UPI00049B07BD|nr:DMT family transporter [Pectobacterium atrosepticum]AIA73242.1 membrane protein [Pectobacterium atrosepticum]AIK16272.1 putative membrane protein [Pectobacterium atrosepticum]POW24952.1 EamA family transporter [Pectobacterium atrosepticum]QWC53156.1 DMT family transporter [Pectobacterium atrosepticum]